MWAGPPKPDGTFDVEDAVTALIRFENGMPMELNAAWASDIPDGVLPEGIVLFGDRGGCRLDMWHNQLLITTERDGRLGELRPEIGEVDPWAAAWKGEFEVFARNVQERREPEASGEKGRVVQRLIDAMYRSADSGRDEPVSH